MDKPPGVAETIDWVAALVALGVADLVAGDARTSAVASLGALAKTPDDRGVVGEAFADYMEGICR
jgi:MoxR-like ATPase